MWLIAIQLPESSSPLSASTGRIIMANSEDDEFESGRLFELYTRYVTEPESKRDVYGYTILVIGYLLGLAGMVIFLVGPTSGELDPVTVLVREISFATAGVGLVSTLLGIVLMLPVRNRGVIIGGLGTIVSLTAAGWFVIAYPGNWAFGEPDYSSAIITMYTIGVASVAGVVVMVPVVTGERSYFAAAREALGQEHADIMLGKTKRGALFTIFQRGADWTWWLIDQSAMAASTNTFLSRLETEDSVKRIKEKVEQAALLEITHAAFRLYQTEEDRWRWLLMQENGNVVADSGDEFPSRQAAESSANDLKDYGTDAEVIAIEEAAFETFPDNSHWRWRLMDDARGTLVSSPERYSDRSAARSGAESFVEFAPDATIITLESFGIELYQENDSWQWRVISEEFDYFGHGSRQYNSKGQVEEAVYDVIEGLESAETINGNQPSYDVFQGSDDSWGWRLVTPESRILAVENEVEADSEAAIRAVQQFKSAAPAADVIEIRNQDFELYEANGEWHWRLVDGDRNVRAHSIDPYESQSRAADAIEHLRLHAPDADLIEFEKAAFQIYESDEGQWRWRLIDEDGNVLADSSEGEYESKDGATAAMSTLQEYAPDAEQLEIETAAFELFEEDGEWGWRLVDDIGETIARGTRRYSTREEAEDDMEALRDEVSDLEARVMDDGAFQIYQDSDDNWWWRFIVPDGTILCHNPTGYGTKHEAEEAINDLLEESVTADVARVGRLAILLDEMGSQWSWEMVDQNRDRVARSRENYGSFSECQSAVSELQAAVESIIAFEIRKSAFIVTNEDGWLWKLVDEEHEALAEAPQQYQSTALAEDAVNEIKELAGDASFIEFDVAAFEVVRSDNNWQWQLIDDDREVVAASTETYSSRMEVEEAIETVKDELPEASILEIERTAFEFHEDEDGWRWRIIDETGNELAESLAVYESRTDAREAVTTVQEYGPDAWMEVND